MKNKENKILSPKLDVIFQALFGEVGSEKITKKFLESIMNKKIEKISLDRNPILRREFKDEKLGVLDIIAELDEKETCNVEMQVVEKDNIVERVLYYWSRLYSKGINAGQDYEILKKTIVILITDFEIGSPKEERCHTKWRIIEDKERKRVLTEKLELHIIQLPKKGNMEESELLDWLEFLEEPESERVIEKMKENEELREAKEKLDTLSADKRMQRIAELRQKAIMDEKATYRLGEKRGIAKEKQEIAKKMLKRKINIEEIMEITGLTKEEIESL